MKLFTYAAILVLVVIAGATGAKAQLIGQDSAYIDTVMPTYKVTNEGFIKGKPDNKFAEIEKETIFAMGVKNKHNDFYFIAPKAHIRVYGHNAPVDTSGAEIRFVKLNVNGTIAATSGAFYASGNGVTELVVPDTQYTYVEMTTTGGTDLKGSKGYFIDAIVIVQDYRPQGVSIGAAFDNSASLTNYPNPFHAGAAATMLAITTERHGDAMVVVADPTGREITRIALGSIDPGKHEVPLEIRESGVYFAQLYLDGMPAGRARKLSAIR